MRETEYTGRGRTKKKDKSNLKSTNYKYDQSVTGTGGKPLETTKKK